MRVLKETIDNLNKSLNRAQADKQSMHENLELEKNNVVKREEIIQIKTKEVEELKLLLDKTAKILLHTHKIYNSRVVMIVQE